jgi:hypothetical protein
MRRVVAYSVALVLAGLIGRAGAQSPKVHTVGKDGLKIEGAVDARDRAVEVLPNPKAVRPLPLPAKEYRLQLKGGTAYRLDLVSAEIDAFLVVQDRDGRQLAIDDDSGGDLNARLTFTPRADGVYRVFAATLKGAGKYTLSVRQDASAPVKAQDVGPGGLRITGTLGPGVTRRVYPVRLLMGKNYVIRMTSPDQKALDPYLRLYDASGKKLAEDDDGGGGLNAQINFPAPATGVYRIEASSYMEVGRGEFNLEVREQ